jgi:nucleotide-binding universal stress UspA family protein
MTIVIIIIIIGVSIDGSEHSMKAAEYAIEIAKQNNAQLIAFTCWLISQLSC